jgi:Domain of unknown function (DUF4150)/VRR-NUC domain
MPSVAVHPPKTPVTKGSNGVAAATLPNICKMPPPPPPFCPTPLPNIGQSGKNPKGYSTTVKIEGNFIAITGASFDSIGDIASKATGGGVVSNNCEGPTKFISPGELSVKVQNKFVQFLGDQMLNNCGPAGAPPNSATMQGEVQAPVVVLTLDQAEGLLCQVFCECKAEAPAKKYESPAGIAIGRFDGPSLGAGASPGKSMNQACVEKKLNDDYKNTNLKPEQSYDMSTNPPSPIAERAAGSRRPDVIRVINPKLPAVKGNIDVFEMKFPGDSYGEGQEKAYNEIAGKPPRTLDSKSCKC